MMLTAQLAQALPVLLLIVVGVLVRLAGLVDRSSRLILTRLVYSQRVHQPLSQL